ncbi:MAG: type I restriction endonuclease subunit R [Methanomicrobia archaeon]|nr:type I restriction endonuclease subunit R [Methanomicrobia archaeon]
MIPVTLSEDILAEQPALEWFRELGYEVAFGPDISPGGLFPERDSYSEVVLTRRLRKALERLNPQLPDDAVEDALHQLLTLDSPNICVNNHRFHLMAVNGIKVEVTTPDGERRGELARVFDFDDSDNNDLFVANQFTVVDGEHNRRPDVVIFVNGLPIANIEVKNPVGYERAKEAFTKNIRVYKNEIPQLYQYNEILVASDVNEARHGTLTADWDWYTPWRVIEEGVEPPDDMPELEVMIKGMFEKSRLLDIIQNFILFETYRDSIVKKMAMYHQYHGVNRAIQETLRATREKGDRKIGVIWHTQGSGKSLSMVFFTAKIIKHPALKNPTILVLTDRNDLDNQIYKDNFSKAMDLIPYPKQAETIEDLKQKLTIPAGGIIFTTIQKFQTKNGSKYPLLSERTNIIVMADEAHRSQYRLLAGNVRDALPHASFIGFTGTPIELEDRSTRVTFGNYISVYMMRQSREDGNTVPIYYEGRLAKVRLTNEFIDEEFEDVTEGEEELIKEKLKSKWARLEAVVGTEARLKQIAQDIVEHFNQRELEGKAMIVCMSRRIAVKMYELLGQIIAAPESAVVITRPEDFGLPRMTKQEQEDIKARFKDPKDPLKFVIVRDMWLTGFDAPCLHTMYVDKPMRDHNLMQAIARVNRVFKDKPGGLIVDYIGIADDLKKSLRVYSDEVRTDSMISIDDAIAVLHEKYDIVCSFFHGIEYANWRRLVPVELTHLMQRAHNAVTTDEETKDSFLRQSSALSKAFALVSPNKEATAIRDDVLFFQSVRRSIRKYTPSVRDASEDVETAIKQLVSEGVSSDEVVDIFGFRESDRPEISILSDEFLNDIQKIEYKNLQVEVLKKLLNDEITGKMKKNVVTYRSFKDMLEKTIARYQTRAIESAEVIERLVDMARELRTVEHRGEKLGLSDEEIAFYDAVAQGREYIETHEQLLELAKKLVVTIKRNLSIDWTDQENVKSKIRASVRRLLKREGFTPEVYEPIVGIIMEQAISLYQDYVPLTAEVPVSAGVW